jgi:glycine betaine/proline transport system ATP-binding protein
VLFFDEPFSALDPLIRRDMQSELIALQDTMHRTIVFITHDFAEALRLGDRIAIMKDGVFDQVGTPEEIVARPATDYVREFTTDIPKSKVLTVRSVMHPGDTNGVRRVPCNTKIGQLIPLLLDSGDPICVVDDDGQPLGIVDRASVAALLGEESR